MKVRFAPSPTGFLHVGGARTALFNWMYAKANGGTFVLRIEDTDLERSKPEFEEEILQSMKWLGLEWDELYKQSDRFDIYRDHAQRLLSEDKAYRDGDAIKLKMPKTEIRVYDLIRGQIDFDTSNFIIRDENMKPVLDENGQEQMKDEVLMKADGSPAYSFCCAVDDAMMGITCVVRGEDHISNTPKQMVIYEALGFKPPKFAHLPLIMGEDGSRLSKRTGAVAVSDYKRKGFSPEAIVNYLMLLGWSPGNNQEIISLDNAVKKFSIKKINKAAAVFSIEKLKWVNSQYLKSMPTEDLMEVLIPFFESSGCFNGEIDRQVLKNIVELFKGRVSTLIDFIEWTDFAFTDNFSVEDGASEKYITKECLSPFEALVNKFQTVDDFNAETAHEAYKETAEEKGFKPGEMIQPLRVALTGKSIGPSLFEIIEILGREKTVQRLQKAV